MHSRRPDGARCLELPLDRDAGLPALRALNYRCAALRERTPPVNGTLEVTRD